VLKRNVLLTIPAPDSAQSPLSRISRTYPSRQVVPHKLSAAVDIQLATCGKPNMISYADMALCTPTT